MFDKFDPVGHPYLTATWFDRLGFGGGDDVGVMDRFMAAYGNVEYNNPGGVMAAVIDFGMVGGIIYYLAAGAIIGWFYGRYRQCQPIGLLGYPLFFVGLANSDPAHLLGRSPLHHRSRRLGRHIDLRVPALGPQDHQEA